MDAEREMDELCESFFRDKQQLGGRIKAALRASAAEMGFLLQEIPETVLVLAWIKLGDPSFSVPPSVAKLLNSLDDTSEGGAA